MTSHFRVNSKIEETKKTINGKKGPRSNRNISMRRRKLKIKTYMRKNTKSIGKEIVTMKRE